MDEAFGLDDKSFLVKQSLNKSLKFLELLEDFIFVLKQIDSSKLAKVINKIDIIFISSYGITSRALNIRKDDL
jgi:hypothetical protein